MKWDQIPGCYLSGYLPKTLDIPVYACKMTMNANPINLMLHGMTLTSISIPIAKVPCNINQRFFLVQTKCNYQGKTKIKFESILSRLHKMCWSIFSNPRSSYVTKSYMANKMLEVWKQGFRMMTWIGVKKCEHIWV